MYPGVFVNLCTREKKLAKGGHPEWDRLGVKEEPFRTILGIRFFTGSVEEAVERAHRGGELVLVPSGPGLADLPRDGAYQEAVEKCDLALTDSGFMVLCWRLITREKLERLSGLRFLSHLVEDATFRGSGESFWIMPSEEDDLANRQWLEKKGIMVGEENRYIAPTYEGGKVEDPQLVERLIEQKPCYILVNIGGGVQEKLGYYLKERLEYGPAVICTGAAIAFLSGRQAPISPWMDRMVLGWLARCLKEPFKFVPRYWKAQRLFWLILRYREKRVTTDFLAHRSRNQNEEKRGTANEREWTRIKKN